MEEKRIRTLLEKIKNGSILSELTEYEDLTKLTECRKRALDIVVYFNERCRLPKYKQIKKSQHSFEAYRPFLQSNNLMFNVTIPDICSVFANRKRHVLELPRELNYATWDDIKRFRCSSGKGGIKSWNKRFESPRVPNYNRYFIALVSKNEVPVFSKPFSFLDYLKTEPTIKQPL